MHTCIKAENKQKYFRGENDFSPLVNHPSPRLIRVKFSLPGFLLKSSGSVKSFFTIFRTIGGTYPPSSKRAIFLLFTPLSSHIPPPSTPGMNSLEGKWGERKGWTRIPRSDRIRITSRFHDGVYYNTIDKGINPFLNKSNTASPRADLSHPILANFVARGTTFESVYRSE